MKSVILGLTIAMFSFQLIASPVQTTEQHETDLIQVEPLASIEINQKELHESLKSDIMDAVAASLQKTEDDLRKMSVEQSEQTRFAKENIAKPQTTNSAL